MDSGAGSGRERSAGSQEFDQDIQGAVQGAVQGAGEANDSRAETQTVYISMGANGKAFRVNGVII